MSTSRSFALPVGGETTTGAQTKADAAQAAAIAASAQRASNLSDLASASTARTNLGLGGAAILAVGTSAGTVAAGNDARLLPTASTAINTVDRFMVTTSATPIAGSAYLQFFTPLQALTVSKITFCASTSGTTGATLIRYGLFTDNGDGTATLVARTASDTGIFAVAGTAYQKPFDTTGGYPASYALTAGSRYATALIIVGGTPGTVRGPAAVASGVQNRPPILSGLVGAGLSDLPTAATTVTTSGQLLIWSELAV